MSKSKTDSEVELLLKVAMSMRCSRWQKTQIGSRCKANTANIRAVFGAVSIVRGSYGVRKGVPTHER